MDYPASFTNSLIIENNKLHNDILKIKKIAENLTNMSEGLVNAQGLGQYILNELNGIKNPPYIHIEMKKTGKKWWKK